MNKFLLLILISALVSTSSTIAQYSWKPTDTIPAVGRHHASVFAIGNFLYVLTGTSSEDIAQYKDMWRYDIAANSWKQLKDFPAEGRSYSAAFTINGKGYFGLGFDKDSTYTDWWEYTPETDTWIPKAPFPGAGRGHPAFFVLKSEGYVGCGDGDTGDYKDFYKYNPKTNTWIRIADFGGPANHHPAFFTIDTVAYVCTGHDRGSRLMLNTNYEYNPTTNKWTKKASLPAEGRVGSIGFAINGTGFIGCGYDEEGTRKYYNDFYAYNPITDTWRTMPNFPDSNGSFAAISAVVGNIAYAGTGMNDKGISNNYWYSFKLNSSDVKEEYTNSKSQLSLRPTPANDMLTLQWIGEYEKIELRNQIGQLIYSQPIASMNELYLTTNEYASGVYEARLLGNGYTLALKVIIAR